MAKNCSKVTKISFLTWNLARTIVFERKLYSFYVYSQQGKLVFREKGGLIVPQRYKLNNRDRDTLDNASQKISKLQALRVKRKKIVLSII